MLPEIKGSTLVNAITAGHDGTLAALRISNLISFGVALPLAIVIASRSEPAPALLILVTNIVEKSVISDS